MTKKYCILISVDMVLNWTKNERIENNYLLQDEKGNLLNYLQIYNVAIDAKKKGFKYIPTCDNVNEIGRCIGHNVEQ